jgi:uncharacterized protein YgiM (DUF1202 family)
VNNQLLIDAWYDHQLQTFSGEIDLSANSVPLRVEYYDNGGGAQMQFSWVPLTAVAQPTPVPPAPTGAIGTVQSARLNVRYGPGVQYGVITQLSKGQTVPLAGYRSNIGNWVMINWNNSTAWVSSLPVYLSTNVAVNSLPVWSGTLPTPGSSVPGTTATVVDVYYLNLRNGPSASNGVIKAMPAGTIVTLLGRNSGSSWAQVRLADGTVGWMSTRYLSTNITWGTLPITG